MICQTCGSYIKDDSKFCSHCGAPADVSFVNEMGELIAKAKQKDADAISELYQKTYTHVFYVVKSMIKDEDTVQDIVQDTYMKAFDHLDSFDGKGNFTSWVKQIAANTTRDYLKKKKPILFTDLGNSEEDYAFEDTLTDEQAAFMPESLMDQKETARLLREIIDELPEDQRAAIGMYYYEKLSVKQIAQAFGVSESAIKSRLMYGRKKIETKVLELEKRGTKLYSLAPFTFFLLLLKKQNAQAAALTPDNDLLQRILNQCAAKSVKNAASTKKAGKAGKAAAAGKTASGGIGVGKIAMLTAAVLILGGGSFFVTSKIIEHNLQTAQLSTVTEDSVLEQAPAAEATVIESSSETVKETETKKELTDEKMITEAMAAYQKIIDQAETYTYRDNEDAWTDTYLYAFVKMAKTDKVPALLIKRQTADARYYAKVFKYNEETGRVQEASEILSERTMLLQRMNDGEGIAYTVHSQGTGEISIYRVQWADGDITVNDEYDGSIMDDLPASLACSEIQWYAIQTTDGFNNWEKDTASMTENTASNSADNDNAPANGGYSDTLPTDGDRIVLTGTVRILDYDEMIDLQGFDPNGGYPMYGPTSWTLIILDSPEMITAVNGDGNGQRTGEAWCINTKDTIGEYNGQHITFSIDSNNTWFPSGTDLPLGQPSTSDINILQ